MDCSTNSTASGAFILGASSCGDIVCASAARVSTTKGTALEIFEKSKHADNNTNLVLKVLSSGHKSLIEHMVFNIAFNNVSVVVEQFLIEHRLASFTVQSRRYVNFKDVGYYIPEDLQEEESKHYCQHMERLFTAYEELMDLDIPKEDARFILPYCFKSNFYCTCNARELQHIIVAMMYGRGKKYKEICALGAQLKEQFEEYFPGVITDPAFEAAPESLCIADVIPSPKQGKTSVSMLSAPSQAAHLLQEISDEKDFNILVKHERARELEFLNYSFKITSITLASLTHLTRHRIQSLLVPSVEKVLLSNTYVMPPSIQNNALASKLYLEMMDKNTEMVKIFAQKSAENLIYFCLSGHMIDVFFSMNARELKHFIALRTCNRAQWEIKDIADTVLTYLKEDFPQVFSSFGPSCVFAKGCPEGKMTCGKYLEIKKRYS